MREKDLEKIMLGSSIKRTKEKIKQCGENNMDNLKKKLIDKKFFSCAEDYEIEELVKEIVYEEFPEIILLILKSIEKCCCKSTERQRNKFKDCVKNKLKSKLNQNL